jgi:polyhydroxybutyrate depolymerase
MIVFHGTDDPVVPYRGGPSTSFHIPFPDVPEWVDHLAKRNGCNPTPIELPLNGEVTGVRYSSCEQNSDVEFYTIIGGGHTWPGGKVIPKFLVGHTSKAIDATKVIWEFFERHPLG